jgi:hypothetical protein
MKVSHLGFRMRLFPARGQLSFIRSLNGDGNADLAVDSSQNSLGNGYCPVFSSTLIVFEVSGFVTARSAKPSPFKSAEATP